MELQGNCLPDELTKLGERFQEEVAALAEMAKAAYVAREQTPKGEKAVPPSEMFGFAAIHREANALFGFLHMTSLEATERAGEFRAAIEGPVHALQEPDRADDEWDEAHGKYLKLMQAYIDSFKEVHCCHAAMMKFYKDELQPKRAILLERSGLRLGGAPISSSNSPAPDP